MTSRCVRFAHWMSAFNLHASCLVSPQPPFSVRSQARLRVARTPREWKRGDGDRNGQEKGRSAEASEGVRGQRDAEGGRGGLGNLCSSFSLVIFPSRADIISCSPCNSSTVDRILGSEFAFRM